MLQFAVTIGDVEADIKFISVTDLAAASPSDDMVVFHAFR